MKLFRTNYHHLNNNSLQIAIGANSSNAYIRLQVKKNTVNRLLISYEKNICLLEGHDAEIHPPHLHSFFNGLFPRIGLSPKNFQNERS